MSATWAGIAVIAALLYAANYGRWRASQRDRYWLKDAATRDHALVALLQVRPGDVWAYFEEPEWMAMYDEERDRLADRDQLRAREAGQ